MCSCKYCEHIHDQDSCQPRRWLSKSLPNYLYQQSQSENNSKKRKAVEKKEPLGSQSLAANIIAQFYKFVEPQK